MNKLYVLALCVWMCAVVFVHTEYPKLCLTLYYHPKFEHFDHFMKCLANESIYHRRSIPRKIVFNIWRCMTNELVNVVFFGKVYTQDDLAFRLATVAIMTILVDRVLPKTFVRENCEVFSFLNCWFCFTFGLMWVDAMNFMQTWYDGFLTK